MRVLNTTKQNKLNYPMRIRCQECDSELEIEEEDVEIGALGLAYVNCPVCFSRVDVDEANIDLTKDNLEFPRHFFHSTDGVDISAKEIKETIGKAIEWFRRNPEDFVYTTEFGNMYMAVYNYSGDNDYHVVVSKDYYDTLISFDAKDHLAQLDAEWKNTGATYINDMLISKMRRKDDKD